MPSRRNVFNPYEKPIPLGHKKYECKKKKKTEKGRKKLFSKDDLEIYGKCITYKIK